MQLIGNVSREEVMIRINDRKIYIGKLEKRNVSNGSSSLLLYVLWLFVKQLINHFYKVNR